MCQYTKRYKHTHKYDAHLLAMSSTTDTLMRHVHVTRLPMPTSSGAQQHTCALVRNTRYHILHSAECNNAPQRVPFNEQHASQRARCWLLMRMMMMKRAGRKYLHTCVASFSCAYCNQHAQEYTHTQTTTVCSMHHEHNHQVSSGLFLFVSLYIGIDCLQTTMRTRCACGM